MATKDLGTAPSGNDDIVSKADLDAKVADAINNGTTTIAPSQNAVFDALALKVGSSDSTVLNAVKITQAAYNALGAGRPATTFYIIVG